jgi:hypothetical protein
MAQRKALLIGVNRYRAVSKLRGCVNDVHHFGLYLKARGFEVRLLTDNRATRAGIHERLKWVTDVPEDGYYWVGFSGHGTQVRDRNWDELSDSLDEAICPYDDDPRTWWDKGLIIDDEWLKLLPQDRTGMVFMDCCHSGTGVRNLSLTDLEIKPRRVLAPVDIAFRAERANGDPEVAKRGFVGWLKETVGGAFDLPVAFIGGCQDDQTSADYLERGCPVCREKPGLLQEALLGYHGALSYAALDYLWACKDRVPTYSELQGAILSKLAGRFPQVPDFEYFGGVDPQHRLFDPQ